MNTEIDKIAIADKELIDFLSITQKILLATKSDLDIKRLKQIIDAFKNNRYEIVHCEVDYNKSKKNNYSIIYSYVEKYQKQVEPNEEEVSAFSVYCKENCFMDSAINKSYDQLFAYLNDDNKLQYNDLQLLFFYMTGVKSKLKKREPLLEELKSYIYKMQNFDDMDLQYKDHKSKYI